MKKTLLSMALMATSGAAVAGDYYNGRLTGMSGAGYATGGYADGVVYNPSLGAKFDERDDFGLVINGGVLGEDEDDLVEGLEELSDYLDELEQRTASDWYDMLDPNDPFNSAQQLQEEEAEEAISRLERVADKTANIGAGGSFVMTLPNEVASLSLVGKTRIEAAVQTVVNEEDYQYIRDAVGQTNFDPAGLQSYGVGRGAAVSEVGLAMAKSLQTGEDSRLLLGVTPKWVHVMTFVYQADVDNFDQEDFDGDQYTVESDGVNIDLGATYLSGKMRYALTVANLISSEYDTIVPGDMLKIEPRATTAVGYEDSWFTAELAADLNVSPSFATGQDTQFVRAGAEFNAANWAQLRVGFQRDLENNMEDTVSVGVGFSPFNIVNVDIAGFTGDGNTAGASMQLGLRF